MLHVDKNWRIEIKQRWMYNIAAGWETIIGLLLLSFQNFCFIISLIPLRTVSAPWSQAKQSLVRPSHSLNSHRELYCIAWHRMALHFVVMYGQIHNLIICFIVFHAMPLLTITVFIKQQHPPFLITFCFLFCSTLIFSILFLFALISRAPI